MRIFYKYMMALRVACVWKEEREQERAIERERRERKKAKANGHPCLAGYHSNSLLSLKVAPLPLEYQKADTIFFFSSIRFRLTIFNQFSIFHLLFLFCFLLFNRSGLSACVCGACCFPLRLRYEAFMQAYSHVSENLNTIYKVNTFSLL